jgi:hypothetical protein
VQNNLFPLPFNQHVQRLEDAACIWIIDTQLRLRDLSLYERGELLIARGKFSQLKEQAKENLAIAGQSAKPFQNSEKVSEVQKVNTTQILADELKTSYDTSSRIIQIQAKAELLHAHRLDYRTLLKFKQG